MGTACLLLTDSNPGAPDLFEPFSLPAPAKLNLFLHITGRRADGYHELQTVFQFLELADRLHFSAKADSEIRVEPELPGIPVEDNLIWRAATTLQQHAGYERGAMIRAEKVIPEGGGLGGGSSDAATTLIGLNHAWKLGYSREKLAGIGLTLGADVPIFLHGHAAWAEGIGEHLTDLAPDEPWYLVLRPDCRISTAGIFGDPELTRNTPSLKICALSDPGLHNDCESVVRRKYPEVDRAMDWLSSFADARLTGTGSCIFAPFAERSEADAVLLNLPAEWEGHVTRGRNRSTLFEELYRLASR